MKKTIALISLLLALITAHAQSLQTAAKRPETLKSLKQLGLIWGFLKYYHPSVTSGSYNWDKELFSILPAVMNAGDAAKRDAVFMKWIDGLGPVTETTYPKANEVKLEPDLKWIQQSGFSEALSALLTKAAQAKRPEISYYMEKYPGVGNPIFKNETAYDSLSFPVDEVRLLTLFRYWNMIQYYYPYKYLAAPWMEILDEFLPKYLSNTSEKEYVLTTLELIGKVNDTHANIWNQPASLVQFRGANTAAPIVSSVEDRAVITGFYNDSLGALSGMKPGDVITAVNGLPVNDIIKAKLNYTPASNYATKLRDIAMGLLRSNDPELNIEFERDHKTLKQTLTTYPQKLVSPSGIFQRKDTCFRMLTPDIGYLYLGSVKSAYLPAIFKALGSAKGLVIDLRCYPSEFIVFTLGKYLFPKPTAFVRFTMNSIQQPGLFTFTPPITVGQRYSDRFKGKIIILVNELSQSQAEYTAMAFRTALKALVVGSTTAGADGNVSAIALPGNIKTAISGIGVYYPDKKETQGSGIIPDVEIRPTIAGIREGKDELVDKAIELINK